MFSCVCVWAQAPRLKLTETTVVKDSGGTAYPSEVWRMLLMRGEYDLRPIDPQNESTEFLLVKLTEEQKLRRLEKMPKPRESDFFKTGNELGLFKTLDIRGNKINLKEEKGKIIVLNFWFINCPPCKAEIPALNEIADMYKGNDSIRFVAIALDAKSELRDFLKGFPFNYNIIDNGRYLADRYGIRSYPTHVVIDQQGKIYFHTTGLAMNTVYWLKKSIADLLSQPAAAGQ